MSATLPQPHVNTTVRLYGPAAVLAPDLAGGVGIVVELLARATRDIVDRVRRASAARTARLQRRDAVWGRLGSTATTRTPCHTALLDGSSSLTFSHLVKHWCLCELDVLRARIRWLPFAER